MVTLLLAGGGTGGHVFPMIAVADAVRSLDPAARLVFVGTPRGLEARALPRRGDDLRLLEVLPLRGGGVMGAVRGAVRAAGTLPEARRIVSSVGPDVVLSVGGYAAGPVALAARSLGVPVALLEPNAVLGLTNRLLAPFAWRAYTAFPEVHRSFRPSVVLAAGVPLRASFRRDPYAPRPGRMSLLVLGGSQGAAALNAALPDAVALATRSFPELTVLHQTGGGRDAEVRERYRELGVSDRATVVGFLDDMAGALADADVVVARAGASSLAELCAVGRAAILVPYPFAAGDHQRRNAESLARVGAAVALRSDEATPERLAAELIALARSPDRRAAMAEAAASRGAPDAARRVAEDLLAIARGRSRREAV